ncbi:MAG: phosphoserine transaminase [Alphaproteobacteria bacterium]
MQPTIRPSVPFFSSGPCTKRPGWTPAALAGAMVGRSHRAGPAKKQLAQVIASSKRLLRMPEDWRLAIVPGSDTGAFEMALWTMLGARGVDILAWESFGAGWANDVLKQLKLPGARLIEAGYGQLPDLGQADWSRDVIFTWNGTTSGVRVPNADWIPADREGLAICDATSAVFAMEIEWAKLDVVTWSWQKVLGGEGGHGMLALGPRAVARLESHVPAWPLPKVFRLVKGGKLDEAPFKGETINTPSMLCVADALDGLSWADAIGGLDALVARSRANLAAVESWVDETPWIDFLAEDPSSRSSTSICLKLVEPWFAAQAEDAQRGLIKALVKALEDEGVAYDIAGHRDAPPGLRVWGGATVERGDIEALLPWIGWAYAALRPANVEAA